MVGRNMMIYLGKWQTSLLLKKSSRQNFRKLENIGILFVYNTKDNALNIRVPSLKSKFNCFPWRSPILKSKKEVWMYRWKVFPSGTLPTWSSLPLHVCKRYRWTIKHKKKYSSGLKINQWPSFVQEGLFASYLSCYCSSQCTLPLTFIPQTGRVPRDKLSLQPPI